VGRMSVYKRFWWTGLVLVLLSACASEPASSDSRADSEGSRSARLDFRRVQVELRLARADTPYLVIAPARGRMEIKLKGALVWECPIYPDSGHTQELESFFDRFAGTDEIVCRPLQGRHVYAYAEQLPDSVLATVAEAAGFSPELIQREIPARMFLLWGDGLLLELIADIDGRNKSPFGNVLFDVKRAITEVGRPSHPVFRTTPEAALTITRVAQLGVLTLVDLTD